MKGEVISKKKRNELIMYCDNTIETIEYRGYTIKIATDNVPINPREELDNTGKMVFFHGWYNLGDDHNYDPGDSIEELIESIKENEDVLLILPVSMYDHSGISFYHGQPTNYWDSGYIGVHYITKESWKKIHGDSEFSEEEGVRILKSELETYQQYINGEVYLYDVIDLDGNSIDSCGGYYGYDYVEKAAKEAVDWEIQSTKSTIRQN